MSSENVRLWAIIFYVALSIGFISIISLIVYFIGRKILQLVINPTEGFGQNLKARLIGLAVAIVAFRWVVPSVAQVFFNSAAVLINGVRLLFYNLHDSIKYSCDNPEAKTGCFGQMGSGFVETATGIGGTILAELRNLPFNSIIGFVTVWALVAFLLDATSKPGDEAGGGFVSLRKIYESRNTPTFRNTMFFVILAISSYLSMAAILAVPELEEKDIAYQEVGIEKLKIQLDEAANSFANYPLTFEIEKPDFFEGITNNIEKMNPTPAEPAAPNAETTENTTDAQNTATAPNSNTATTAPNSNTAQPVAKQSPSPVTAPKTGGSQSTVNPASGDNNLTQPQKEAAIAEFNWLKTDDKRNQAETKRLFENYKTFIQEAKNRQSTDKQNVQQNYEVNNLVGKGNKERIKYFLSVTNWFNQKVSSRNQLVSACLSEIQGVNAFWQQFSAFLQRNRNNIDEIRNRETDLSYSIGRANSYCSDFAATEDRYAVERQIPDRPKLGEGSDLGVFHYFTYWLLKTESLSFALITGLLGFGLLGAACSTFIREKVQKITPGVPPPDGSLPPKDEGVLVNDLTEVVVRGVAAAIVVFLALKGGLAIFSSGNGQPNSYVLLLTCLVAAVYSDSIWLRVQEEFIKKFRKGGSKDSENEEDSDESENSEDEENSDESDSGDVITCAVEPKTGTIAGGGTVTIAGTNFDSAKSVMFGDAAATNVSIADKIITATFPAHEAGEVEVIVENNEGIKAAGKFTYEENAEEG